MSKDKINLQNYIKKVTREKNDTKEAISNLDKSGASYLLINDIAFTRNSLVNILNRTISRINGIERYINKVEKNEWRDVHEVLIEKLAEQEYEYHIRYDTSFFLESAKGLLEKVVNDSETSKKDTVNAIKNALNNISKANVFHLEEKSEWVQNRFFELASRIDFQGSDSIFPNIKDLEKIHPLDIVSLGNISLQELKENGNHRDVFSEELTSIKTEAIKETFLYEYLSESEIESLAE